MVINPYEKSKLSGKNDKKSRSIITKMPVKIIYKIARKYDALLWILT
ncbi:MAG: hypothetical protein MI866_18620 [Bacteroidales bacterium]|nr:hypothetical protein [Bacteroidales bacterium]